MAIDFHIQTGVGFYRDSSSSGNHLYVDWAKLSMSAPSAVVPGDGIEISDPGIFVDLNQVENFNVAP